MSSVRQTISQDVFSKSSHRVSAEDITPRTFHVTKVNDMIREKYVRNLNIDISLVRIALMSPNASSISHSFLYKVGSVPGVPVFALYAVWPGEVLIFDEGSILP